MRGLPQGGKWHRFPPPPRRSQILWPTTAVRFSSGRASPPRLQRGGRLQVQSRHCAGEGGWRSPRRLSKPFPKLGLSPRVPAALSLCFPNASAPGAVWKGRWEPLRGSTDWDLGRDGARPRLSLEFAASLAPGKFFSKFPAASAQVASAGRGDGCERASLAAPSTGLRARLLGAARVPGGQALLPGAKAAADAGGSEGGSRPPRLRRPYRSAYTWGLHGSPGLPCTEGAVQRRRSAPLRATGSPTFPPGSFLMARAPRGQWSACGGPLGGHATRSVPQLPTPSQFLPSQTTRRKGACPMHDTPLMNINIAHAPCSAC